MKKTFAVYGIGYLVLLIVVLGLMYVHPKLELHLMLNSHHSPILDTFFTYYSILAEWPSTYWHCCPYSGKNTG